MSVAVCPSQKTLHGLLRGEISEDLASDVSSHIRNCSNCQSHISEMEQQSSDSLLSQLRSPTFLSEILQEPDCKWAISRAHETIAGPRGDEPHEEILALPVDLGDYQLIESIGRGGMGVVYRAHHQRLSRDVAVKIISDKRLVDARSVQRFEAEMRALGRLSHPNIVTALDAREVDGQPVLVMEYVDGLDLSEILSRLGPLPESIVAAIGSSIAKALDYASNHHLVHRDVKPSNVMINKKGEVKLLDLGLARIRMNENSNTDRTGTGLALGTADYMSPEQINDSREVDIRSDLYSLGCTLYKLLTGHTPYSGPKYVSNFSKLSAHVSSEPIAFPASCTNKESALSKLVLSLVEKLPANRPVSGLEVVKSLEEIAQGADLTQLVNIALKSPRLANTSAVPEPSLLPSKNEALQNQPPISRIPPTVTWLIAAAALPIGIWLGIWLTVERPDGSKSKIELPDNAVAKVSPIGDVSVALEPAIAEASSTKEVGADSTAVEELAKSLAGKPATKDTSKKDKSDPYAGDQKSTAEVAIIDRDLSEELLGKAIEQASASKEPVYRGYPFSVWMELLKKEQDPNLSLTACHAVTTLATTVEQKSVAFQAVLLKGKVLIGSTQWNNICENTLMSQGPSQAFEVVCETLKVGDMDSQRALIYLIGKVLPHYRYAHQLQFEERLDVTAISDTQAIELIARLSRILENTPNVDREETIGILFHLAILKEIPFAKLPPLMQEVSKKDWEVRKNQGYRNGLKPRQDRNGYRMNWLPYWRTLDANERDTVIFISSLFGRSRNPRLNTRIVKSILNECKNLDPKEYKFISIYMAASFQQSYHSAFQNGSQSEDYAAEITALYLEILDWFSNAHQLSPENLVLAKKHVNEVAYSFDLNILLQAGYRLAEILEVDTKSEEYLKISSEVNGTNGSNRGGMF